jgi:periplasmic divalent cation tolerance protein
MREDRKMTDYCLLYLSCKDSAEAEKIAHSLLEKHLISCAKQVPTTSAFRWQGKIENAEEILLIMESRENLFDKVEAEIAKLHSYDTFVLEAVPVSRISKNAKRWVEDELISGD